jgi:hypothetical protein
MSEQNPSTNVSGPNQIDYKSIFEDIKKDPTLLSTLDINALLRTIPDDRVDYLNTKTLNDVGVDILESFDHFVGSPYVVPGLISEFCHKLIGYRFVDEIYKLHKGKHVRWVRFSPNDNHHINAINITTTPYLSLTNGGIVVDIKFLDDGVHILCKNNMNRFIQYRFDDCLTYQKLSYEEQLVLMVNEQINRVTPFK